MLAIYDYAVELDDPRPMNHSNIISIITYLYHKTLADGEVWLGNKVGENFFSTICSIAFDLTKGVNDNGLPYIVYDWGEYRFTFTSRLDTDGIIVDMIYEEDRIRPSLEETDENDTEDISLDELIPHRDPFYASPYEPYYWYNKYDFMYHWEKKLRPVDNECDCECCNKDVSDTDTDTTDTTTDTDTTDNQETEETSKRYETYSCKLSHADLVDTIEIYQLLDTYED